MKLFPAYAAAFLFAAALLPFNSCQEIPDRIDDGEFGVSVSPGSVAADKTGAFVTVLASVPWSISVEGEDCSWITAVTPNSGSGNKADVRMEFQPNSETRSRSVTIVLASSDGKSESRCEFIQGGVSRGGIIETPWQSGWLELPAMPEGEDYYLISHPMTVSGKTTRNYSCCWDLQNFVSIWVAYPLNNWNMQGHSGYCSYAWGWMDPCLPDDCQPLLSSSYSGFGCRGHQIPSADRQIKEANEETFYGTNMVPQDYDLNSGEWAKLEQKVRTWATKFDTLYVATGCVIEKGGRTTRDNRGHKVAIPTAFFKALLGYKKNKTIGITSSTGGYTGVGFCVSNSDIPDYTDGIMTLEDLEYETGLTFFANLEKVIGESAVRKVKTTQDSYWW